MDCFYVGRLRGVKGAVWQYTAIDVASSYTWAELWTTPRNPSAERTSNLARRVAEDLSARGWKLQAVMSDNASEYRSKTFRNTITGLGSEHRFIRDDHPQTNGCVERVQQTILEECWKPAFARYLNPQNHGSANRPGTVPRLLQPRPGTHRQMAPRTHPRTSPRETYNVAQTSNKKRRPNSAIGHLSPLRPESARTVDNRPQTQDAW